MKAMKKKIMKKILGFGLIMVETLVGFGSGIKLCIQIKTAASNVGWLLFSLHSSIKIKSRERQLRILVAPLLVMGFHLTPPFKMM